MPLRTRFRLLTLFGLFAVVAQPAAAEDFYAGKTVSIIVGSAPGGSYDLYARLVAQHIGKHIPGNPKVIVQNMPGANSQLMAGYVADIAPKDGTALGAPLNTVPLNQMLQPDKTKFNAAKFNWIGAVSSPANVLVTWHTSGVKTLDAAKEKEVTIGATTAGTTQEMYPLMANNLFGTKFKVITGYKASTEINIAMERGEVQGRGANTYLSYRFQNPDWIRDKKINFIFQMTEERDPEMKDVPTLLEYAKTDEQRKIVSLMVTTESIGRSYFAPPGVPADRVALLRKALAEVVKDPAFLADAEKSKLEITPVAGEKLQKMVEELIATPPDIIAKYKEAVSRKN
ncbi:MAG TPA: tripartite tricarboxylate transporter substrate-binding protein [Xanthobacteraceae bacterium]|nr:tripartite tricarboxylate transporter substrate-binding protein [Xanthobacteraceae bacterium]